MALPMCLLAVACDLSPTEPEVQRRIDIQLDFCASRMPIWFGFLNQDEEWARVLPDAAGTFSFTATNRVMVAYVYQTGGNYETEVLAVGNTELEKISGVACVDQSGTKTVTGTVAGVSGTQLSRVGMATSAVRLLSHQTSFSLSELPDRPVDLVASRFAVSGTVQQADRIIVRRSQMPAAGSALALVDFNATEALAPATNTATVSGVLAGEQALLVNNLFTALGTSQILTTVDAITTNGQSGFSSLPSSARIAGDYHDIFAVSADGDGGARGAERFFFVATNVTLPLGPPLPGVTITTVASAPFVRLRAQFSSQLDYAGYVSAVFEQNFQQIATTKVSVFATPAFFRGRPSTWTLDVPDMSGASGWQNGWGLQTGTNIDWTVSAVGGRSDFVLGIRPNDGESLRFAVRTSLAASVQPTRGDAFAGRGSAAVASALTARPRPLFARAR
jgi:hypothetical protein